MELSVQFYNWFGGKSCRPFAAPNEIELHRKADDGIHVVQPDLMVICDLEQHLNEEDHYTDTPSLVVEILSESTRRKDLIYKLNLYMTCGVREYWIVNPFTKEVTVYLFPTRGHCEPGDVQSRREVGVIPLPRTAGRCGTIVRS